MSVYVISLRSSIHSEYTSWGLSLKETNIETCGTKLQCCYCNRFEQKIPLNPLMIIEKNCFCSQIIFCRFKKKTELDLLVTVSLPKPKAVGLCFILRM
jgi:hypothetical protein